MAAAAPSPNPTNLLLLAALGIGVYWFMTRKGALSTPAVIYPTPAQNAQAYGDDTKALKYQLVGGLIGKAFDYFGNQKSASPYTFDTGGSYGLQPTGSLGLQAWSDGLAFNPGSGSASDSIYSLLGAKL